MAVFHLEGGSPGISSPKVQFPPPPLKRRNIKLFHMHMQCSMKCGSPVWLFKNVQLNVASLCSLYLRGHDF